LKPTRTVIMWMPTLYNAVLLLIVIVFLLLLETSIESELDLVNTQAGTIRGTVFKEKNFRQFLGIPYAEPPVRHLRWKPPKEKTSWSPSILDTREPPAQCPQSGQYITFNVAHVKMSEDCLYLNIWTPILNASALKPVMVFIHGGGWQQGTSAIPVYYGDYFANSTNTILVTLNYRLGALGFMVTPEVNGNLGIMDQIMALQWVKNNIRAFGGNPDQITLFGQSAGGISVSIHLTLPSHITSQNLFQRAIIQSNPLALKFRKPKASMPYSVEFSALLGCGIDIDMTCLRNKTVEQILKAQESVLWVPFPIGTRDNLPWQPTLDDELIIGQPWDLIRNGNYSQNVKSVILGTVRNELDSFLLPALNSSFTTWKYETLIFLWFPKHAHQLLQLYPPDKSGDNSFVFSRLITDLFFACPTRNAASWLSKRGTKTYLYQFLLSPLFDPFNNSTYCHNLACHGSELPFVFHSMGLLGFHFANEIEKDLSWTMLKYWAMFASGQDESKVWNWTRFSFENYSSMAFNSTAYLIQNYHKAECDLWDQIGDFW
jgi:carboxylesterase type B